MLKQTCPGCNGDKNVLCLGCDANRIRGSCARCGGIGYFECHVCNGKGYLSEDNDEQETILSRLKSWWKS